MDKEDDIYICIYIYMCIYKYIYIYTYIYIYIYNETLLSHKTEWNSVHCKNADGSRVYYACWNKAEKERFSMLLLICGI